MLSISQIYKHLKLMRLHKMFRCFNNGYLERRLQVSTADVHGAFHGCASAYDYIYKGCSGEKRKGHFSVDVAGTSFCSPPSIPYQFQSYPQCVKKIYHPSMSDDRLRWSGKCGGYRGYCAQGRIKLARCPWHIFRAGLLALVVGVGGGGGGRGGTRERVKLAVSLRKFHCESHREYMKLYISFLLFLAPFKVPCVCVYKR